MRRIRSNALRSFRLKPVACRLALAACSALAAPHAVGAEIPWTSGLPGNWSDGANWQGGTPPGVGDVAVFGPLSGGSSTSNSWRQINLLRFDAGAMPHSVFVTDYLGLEAGIQNDSADTQTVIINPTTGHLRINTGTVTGAVNISNNDELTFANTATAGTARILNNGLGMLNFMMHSSAGTADITNNSAGTINFNFETNAGLATIQNNAGGTVNFLERSHAGSATIVNEGAVDFYDDAHANGAHITTQASGTTIFRNNASAADSIHDVKDGILGFTDNATANNALIDITGGGAFGTYFEGDATAGSATISVTSGLLVFQDNTDAGSADITNADRVLFSDSASAANAQIENNNILGFINTSSAGSSIIVTNNGATTSFRDDSTGGTARLIVNAGGTVDVTNHNSMVEVGSIEGAGTINFAGRGLSVGTLNTDTTFSGNLVGAGGGLRKVGTGTLTLTGVGTHTAGTYLAEGRLVVDGALSSFVIINGGATLGGSGTVGTVTANANAVVAPGNSIGTLNINGDYVAEIGSIYEVEVNDAGASDLLDITGTATLNGGTVRVLAEAGTYAASTTYTILTAAGGITGNYSNVTSNFAFLVPTLDRDAGNVYLTLTRNDAVLSSVALTRNQRAVSRSLDGGVVTPPAALAGIYTAITGASAEQARAYYDQLSGDALAAFPALALDDANRFNAQLHARSLGQGAPSALAGSPAQLAYGGTNLAQLLNAADTSASATSAPEQWAAWVSLSGSRSDADDDGNGPGFSAGSTGLQLGLETLLRSGVRVGGALGHTHTRADVGDGRDADGKTDSWHAGLYAGYDSARWFGSASLSYAGHDIDSKRNIDVGGPSQARANIDAHTFSLWGEFGWHLGTKKLAIDPSLSLRIARTHVSGFREKGSPAALAVESENVDSQRLGFGVRLAGAARHGSAQLRPSLSVRYERELGDRAASLDAQLSGLDAFSVRGSRLGRDILSLGLALEANIGRNLMLYSGLDAAWRKHQDLQSVQAGLKYVW